MGDRRGGYLAGVRGCIYRYGISVSSVGTLQALHPLLPAQYPGQYGGPREPQLTPVTPYREVSRAAARLPYP